MFANLTRARQTRQLWNMELHTRAFEAAVFRLVFFCSMLFSKSRAPRFSLENWFSCQHVNWKSGGIAMNFSLSLIALSINFWNFHFSFCHVSLCARYWRWKVSRVSKSREQIESWKVKRGGSERESSSSTSRCAASWGREKKVFSRWHFTWLKLFLHCTWEVFFRSEEIFSLNFRELSEKTFFHIYEIFSVFLVSSLFILPWK